MPEDETNHFICYVWPMHAWPENNPDMAAQIDVLISVYTVIL